MKYKVYILSLCFLFCIFFLQGQNQEGISQSNYSPTITMLNNPTSVVNSKVLLDVHLIGADFFMYNNYAYYKAKDFDMIEFLKTKKYPFASFDNSKSTYSFFSTADVQLFSAAYQYKEHGFGFSARVRTFIDLRKLPQVFFEDIKVDQLKGQNQEPNLNNFNRELSADKMSMTTLSYNDIALTYANAITHFDHDLIIVGGSLKYLLGNAGGGLKADDLSFVQDTNDVVTYSNLDISAAGAIGDVSGKFSEWFAANGFAFDIGITYKKMLDNVTYYNPFSPQGKCRQYDYKWKVSASIVDLGILKFNKYSTYTQVTADAGTVQNFSSLNPVNDPEEFVSEDLGPNVNVSKKKAFSMWLPSALVLQADYNFQNHFYFSGQFTHGFHRDSYFSVQRPHMLTLMPRYERRWLEISMPFSLYNYQEVRTGLMLRVGPLTMGTDKLGTLLSITNVTGFDFYFHLAFKFYKKKGCGQRRDNRDYDVTKCRRY